MKSICLSCGEDKEFNVSIKEIFDKNIIIEIECKNCLSKLTVEGRYFFTSFTHSSEETKKQQDIFNKKLSEAFISSL